MSTKNPTFQKYRIKRTYDFDWFDLGKYYVYYGDEQVGHFNTYESALSYTIGRIESKYARDWLLTYAYVDSRWIMFLINEKRNMFCVLDNRHADSVRTGASAAHQCMLRLKSGCNFKREMQGIVIFSTELDNKLKEATRGDWVKYALPSG